MMTVAEEANRYVLTVACASARGQVAALSGFLDERSCYISEFAQFDDATTHRFFAAMLVLLVPLHRCAVRPDDIPSNADVQLKPRTDATESSTLARRGSIVDAAERARFNRHSPDTARRDNIGPGPQPCL
jgi:hypothetical protein